MVINDPSLLTRFKEIRLAIFDVDGVLTDGRLYYDNHGNEFKAFHAHDGHGMKQLQQAGIPIAIITARKSELVAKRMHDLGVVHLFQGARDKLVAFNELLAKLSISANQVCYVGDDSLDVAVMRRCGVAIAVANAQPIAKQHAHCITEKKGGEGAAREVCDTILHIQGKLEAIMNDYVR